MFEDLGEKIVNLGSSVKDGAAKAFDATKSGVNNLSREISLKGQIDDSQKEIKNIYLAIGERYYIENQQAAPAGYEDDFAKIAAANKAIEDAEGELRNLSGTRICPQCHGEVKKGFAFCTSCGCKMPQEQEETQGNEEQPSPAFCSACGSEVEPDAVFCSSCGARIAKG